MIDHLLPKDISMRKRSLAIVAAPLLVALSSAAFACNGSVARWSRDATCSGQSLAGAPSSPTAANTSGSSVSNAVPIGASPGTYTPAPANECVMSASFTTTGVLGSTPPSFISLKGNGYIGYGAASNPATSCLTSGGDLYSSCTPWVPAAYPYLLQGGSLQACTGPLVAGSKQCSRPAGLSNYVSQNVGASPVEAYMISCKTSAMTPSVIVGGAPLSWWADCPDGICKITWTAPVITN